MRRRPSRRPRTRRRTWAGSRGRSRRGPARRAVSTWNPIACSTCALGSVRSRADSQPWIRRTPGAGASPAGRNQPGRRSPSAVGTSTSSYARPTASGVQVDGWRWGNPARARYTTANRYASATGAAATAVAMAARRRGLAAITGPSQDERGGLSSVTPAIHSRGAVQGPPCRARRRTRRHARRDQGRLASARAPAPPGPDRRRSRGRPAGHAPDGRDQRCLCRAHARGAGAAGSHARRRRAPRPGPGPGRGARAARRPNGRRARSPRAST